MSVIILLIIISLLLATGFLISFIWSVDNGQIDDDYTPSVRMLFDSTPSEHKNSEIETPENSTQQQCQSKNSATTTES